jgi:hypothetical protein
MICLVVNEILEESILTAGMNITKNHMNNQFGLQYCFMVMYLVSH